VAMKAAFLTMVEHSINSCEDCSVVAKFEDELERDVNLIAAQHRCCLLSQSSLEDPRTSAECQDPCLFQIERNDK
jgi:hypothetical protein